MGGKVVTGGGMGGGMGGGWDGMGDIPTLYQQVPAPWPVLCTHHQLLVQMQCGSHQYHCQLQTWTQSAMY